MRTQLEHFHKRARLYVLGAAILIILFALFIPNVTAKVILIILTIIAFAVLTIVEWLKKDDVTSKKDDAGQAAKASAEKQKPEETKRKAEEAKKAEEPKKAEEAKKTEAAKKPKAEKAAAPDDGVTTRTGRYCVEDGTYHCSEHPDRTVEMVVGKRFPPCRGDGKGHSAIWTLST